MPTNKITSNVTVGSADIYINGLDVGHLKETVEVITTREKLPFKPANELGEVVAYAISEQSEIRARVAELNVTNIRLALGIDDTAVVPSTDIPVQTGDCSYDQPAGSSWDSLTWGGDKSENEFCVRLEHTRPNGNLFIVIFYKAISMTELNIPFAEDEFTLHDLVIKGLTDSTRARGDMVGVFLDQVN
jgi:hypothetical protein